MKILANLMCWLFDVARGVVATVLGLAAIVCALLAHFKFADFPPMYVGALLLFVLAYFVFPPNRKRTNCGGVEIMGVEMPRRTMPRRRPPETTAETLFDLCCAQVDIETDADAVALMQEVQRHIKSFDYTNYADSIYGSYWEPTTEKQADFLRAMGYNGPMPKYLGEASNLITSRKILRDYLLAKSAIQNK